MAEATSIALSAVSLVLAILSIAATVYFAYQASLLLVQLRGVVEQLRFSVENVVGTTLTAALTGRSAVSHQLDALEGNLENLRRLVETLRVDATSGTPEAAIAQGLSTVHRNLTNIREQVSEARERLGTPVEKTSVKYAPQVLEQLRESDSLTSRELAELCHLPLEIIEPVLRQLEREGLGQEVGGKWARGTSP